MHLLPFISLTAQLSVCSSTVDSPKYRFRDCKPAFCELISKDNSVTVQQGKLQKLPTEKSNVKVRVAPVIISNVSDIVQFSYNLINTDQNIFEQPNMVLISHSILGQNYENFCQMTGKSQQL